MSEPAACMSVFGPDYNNLTDADVRRFWKMLCASAVVALASAVAGTAGLPRARTRLVHPRVAFNATEMLYEPAGAAPVGGGFTVFAVFLATNYFVATSDVALFSLGALPNSASRRAMEALSAALSALGAYTLLGGVTLGGALTSGLLLFYCFYTQCYDGVWLAAFAGGLASTLLEALFVEAPEAAPRAVFAATHLAFTLASGFGRAFYVRADLAVVVGAAGRAAALGQAYSLLERLGGAPSELASDVFVLASVVPVVFFAAYAYTATEQAAKQQAPPQLRFNTGPPPKKKKHQGCARPSFVV